MAMRGHPHSDSVGGPAGAPVRRSSLAAGVSLGAAVAIYLAQVALYLPHVNDDAYITFRYSRFLAVGLGPYFNVGEHVEGYTNFLHMVLMAVAFAVGGESAVPLAAKIVGIVGGSTGIVLAFLIGRRLVEGSARLASYGALTGSLAAALVAVVPGYALNSTSGLETTMFAALLTLGVYLGLRAQTAGAWRGAGVAWAAAALTRPEGLPVFAVYWISHLIGSFLPSQRDDPVVAGRRHLVLDGGVVALVVFAHLAFRYMAYDGELLPNTFYAKAEGFWGTTAWEYVRQGALAPFFGVLGLSLALAGWWRSGLMRTGMPVVSVALFGAFLPFVVGGDWMPGWRFSVPFLPVLAVVVAAGWVHVLAAGAGARSVVMAGAAVVLVAVSGSTYHHERVELADHLALRAAGYATGHRALANWIRDEVAAPGDAVALMDIGIVGYYCPEQRILDISGLTDRHIAKSPGALLKKEYDPGYVLDQEPKVVVLVISAFGDPRQPLPADARFGTWIDIENKIYNHPYFRAAYKIDRDATSASTTTGTLAARFGAERVFEHAHPDQFYFLAAFVRRP